MKTSIKSLHPGVFLRTEIIEPLGLDINKAASILGVKPQILSALLRAKIPLEPEMAWRFEQAFDLGMEGLLKMQACYDAAMMRSNPPSVGIRPYIPDLIRPDVLAS
jgi:addiction module HigA family antidote